MPAREGHTRGAPLRIAANGDLVVKTDGGEMFLHKPVVYQEQFIVDSSQLTVKDEKKNTADNQKSKINNRKSLEGNYVLEADNQVGFKVGSYDHTRPLVIDPALSYSTYLGGSVVDNSYGVAVDSLGYAYVVGSTESTNFPSAGSPVQSTCEGCSGGYSNVFVTKVNTTGTVLVYSTFLGDGATGFAIAVDSTGDAYLTGTTGSNPFPIANAWQGTNNGGGEAFVTELNPTGSSLVYSSYLGGSLDDYGTGIATDSSGNTYVTGVTFSSDFPTAHPYESTCKSCGSPNYQSNAFVAKLHFDPDGNTLTMVYSTFLGGSNGDVSAGIAVDSSGNTYITGQTNSSDFPTLHPLSTNTTLDGGPDAFVTKLNWSGSALSLVYSTYLGGGDTDSGQGIAVDSSNNAYVTGWTVSTDFPLANPYQATNKASIESENQTAFVTKLNWSGSALSLVYSTFLGGSGLEKANGIAIDSTGNAYVTGVTYSADFPTTANAIQATCPLCNPNEGGLYDAFVAELTWTGSAMGLPYSTYLGGTGGNAQGYAIAVDSLANAYVTGQTGSTLLTSTNAFQGTYGGEVDAFVTKISLSTAAPSVGLSSNSLAFGSQNVETTSAAQTLTVTNNGTANLSISAVALGGTNPGDFAKSADACTGATVTPGNTCTVSVTFTPSAAGSRSASLSFTDNASDSPESVSLTGTGTVPVAGISPPSLTFNSQNVGTTSASQPVTLSNTTGTGPLTITSIVASANFGQTNTCGGSVAAGSSCTINVTFSPTAASSLSGTLTVTDNSNGVAGSTQSVTLGGTGTGVALASLSASSINFGNQPINTASAAQTVTVTNTGTINLSILTVALGGTNASDFAKSADTCTGAAVPPSHTCTVSVTFTPAATGTRSGMLTFTDNNNNVAGSTQAVALSGVGVDFAVASPTGTQTVAQGGSAQYTINVTSLGGTDSSAVTLACSNLPAQATCAFSPTTATPGASGASSTLTITTAAPVYARMLPPFSGHPPAPLPGLLLAMMLPALVGWWRVRRTSPRWVTATSLLLGVLLATTFMAGCGAGGYPLPKVGGTPASNYNITITGTSGSTSHTTTVALTVTAS